MTEMTPGEMTPTPPASTGGGRRRWWYAGGLLAAGTLVCGILAGTLTASAADSAATPTPRR